MRAYDTIHRKREGHALTDDEIREFIRGYTKGEIPDYQAAALLMAVFFQGMTGTELRTWTDAMLHSGEIFDLTDIPGRKVDKHSTGGVGDKVSLCLAPIVAACGVRVPMVSGRGLGHTGGTLDKLEAIEGFDVNLSADRFRELVAKVGVCLIGQTETIAPADRKMYALRDVTATVESIPLISSSILSKKLAEGIDALVLDVKVGEGAFMRDEKDARELARTMVDLGTRMGTEVVALLTDMNQPLGRAVGNALEVIEAVEVLRGTGPDDLTELTLHLAAEMLVLGQVADDREAGRARAENAVADGSALEVFRKLVEGQNGDVEVVDDYSRLPTATRTVEVKATGSGYVTGLDAKAVGVAAMRLGAGRATKESVIDHAVGLVLNRKIGDEVRDGDVLCTLHVNDETDLESVVAQVQQAYRIEDQKSELGPLVIDRISA